MDISPYAMILFIGGVLVYGLAKRVDCLPAFADGARNGLLTCWRVLPHMAAMLVAVALLRASGLLEALTQCLQPVARLIGLPAEALPMVLIRPFSGSAALAMLADTLASCGPDSAAGRAVCIIMGSSETLFYTAGLYFGSIGVKQWRHTIPAALVSSLAGVMMAAWLC